MDIKPVQNQFYDCFSANLVTISIFKKKDYYMWFSNRLNLNFSQQDYIWSILKDYHGITKEDGIINLESDFTNLVREELSQGNPLIFATDIYNCPWNAYYKKRHYTHYVQIIDYEDAAFICLDPFFTSNKVKFPILELSREIKYIILKYEAQRENLIECLSYIRYFLSLYLDNITGGEFDINVILKDLNKNKKVENEYDMYDIYGITSVNSLINIDNNRECFMEMLAKIQDLFHVNMAGFINRINISNTNLRILRAKVLRQALATAIQDMENTYYTLINEIIQNEKVLVLDFLDYINKIISQVK